MEGLHASAEHLGSASHLLDGNHLDPCFPQGGGGAPGGDDLITGGRQPADERDQPGLVVHADQRPAHSHLTSLPSTARRPATNASTTFG